MIKLSNILLTEAEITAQSLPQGSDDISKATRLKEILKNRFLSINIETGLTNIEEVNKLSDDLEKADEVLRKVINKYEYTDENKFDQLSEISSELTAMWNCLYTISKAFEKYQYLKTNLNLQ
jgi:DNA-binding protein